MAQTRRNKTNWGLNEAKTEAENSNQKDGTHRHPTSKLKARWFQRKRNQTFIRSPNKERSLSTRIKLDGQNSWQSKPQSTPPHPPKKPDRQHIHSQTATSTDKSTRLRTKDKSTNPGQCSFSLPLFPPSSEFESIPTSKPVNEQYKRWPCYTVVLIQVQKTGSGIQAIQSSSSRFCVVLWVSNLLVLQSDCCLFSIFFLYFLNSTLRVLFPICNPLMFWIDRKASS